MIYCNRIAKRFGARVVFKDLSCSFGESGVYLLLGESGSGKTTFLNTLAGFIPFDEGTIEWNGEKGTERVTHQSDDFDYITQDSIFIDFLTAKENLMLTTPDEKRVEATLERIGLTQMATEPASCLSGGERQRLAIARALLKGKKVLLIDEPTASLDADNKKRVFELLESLKEDVLIICATHDREAVSYADYTLHFSKEGVVTFGEGKHRKKRADGEESLTREKNGQKAASGGETERVSAEERKKALRFCVRKWMKSGKREKRGRIWLGVILFVAFCAMSMADFVERKEQITEKSMYKQNYLEIRFPGNIGKEELPDAKELLLLYTGTVPDDAVPAGGSVMVPIVSSVDPFVKVLPKNEDVFALRDRIRYGTYFTGQYQTILSSEMAEKMSGGNPESLIGTTISRDLYGYGDVQLEIVGIFDKLTYPERCYLYSGDLCQNGQYDSSAYSRRYFISSEMTEMYWEDADCTEQGLRKAALYFDSFEEMNRAREEMMEDYPELIPYVLTLVQISAFTESRVLFIFFVSALAAAIFAVMFYIEIRRTEAVYNNGFIGVLEYSGFSKKQILREIILANMVELVAVMAVSGLTMLVTTMIFNAVNSRMFLLPVVLFTYNPWFLFLEAAVMIATAFLYLMVQYRKIRDFSWYENLIQNRDLF